MAIVTFKARVAEHAFLAKKFQMVDLELVEPKRLEFTAGQYIMLKVPGLDGVRQYSITSPPSNRHAIELLIDVIPTGAGSLYIASMTPGDEVEFMAPAGKFVVDPDKEREKELWFVATGSGIAPIKAMLVDLLVDKKDKRPMWLHWGLRFAEDVFWFDDFARLSEEYSNFTFDLALSKPPKEWKLCRGYTTNCVMKHHSEFANIGAYVSGNRRMIEDVKARLIEKGVAKERIHTEQFYE